METFSSGCHIAVQQPIICNRDTAIVLFLFSLYNLDRAVHHFYVGVRENSAMALVNIAQNMTQIGFSSVEGGFKTVRVRNALIDNADLAEPHPDRAVGPWRRAFKGWRDFKQKVRELKRIVSIRIKLDRRMPGERFQDLFLS